MVRGEGMGVLMKKRLSILTVVLLAVLTGSQGVPAVAAASAGSERKNTLVIAAVSDNPKKHYRYLKPMVDYAASQLGAFGITEGKVVLAKNNRQLVEYLRQGKVDWVTETTFAAVICQQEAGAEIILKKWKKGVDKYHTVFFARKESNITSLSQLKGKTIAFEEPDSTSAFYVPYAILVKAGIDPVRLESVRHMPKAGTTGYVFAGEEVNQSAWVYKGLVDAAAFSNTDWDEPDNMPEAFRKELQIFYRSGSFPRAVELVRKDLDPALKNALKKILIEADRSADGRKALKAYHKSTRIELLDAESRAGIEEAKRILETLQPGIGR